jgi:hypothetical protein
MEKCNFPPASPPSCQRSIRRCTVEPKADLVAAMHSSATTTTADYRRRKYMSRVNMCICRQALVV